MKIETLRDLSPDELRTKEHELGEELFHLRLRRTTQQLSNPMKLRETRQTLARVKTLLGERARGGKGQS